MNNYEIASLFFSNIASAKLYKVVNGTFRRYGDDTDDKVNTIPHGLGNDQLYVGGWVKTTNSTYPGEVYYFGLPYIDALGDDIFTVTWDTVNVYIENPWDGGGTGNHSDWQDFEYTVIVLIA